jgi:hypothetical protein
MNINVPESARAEFWEEPPPGNWEFWSFRFKPPCKIGEQLIFRFDKKPVATAVVAKIEPPGKTECERTGRFRSGWKVFWEPQTFKKL